MHAEEDSDEEGGGNGKGGRRTKVTRDMLNDEDARRRWDSTRAVSVFDICLDIDLLTSVPNTCSGLLTGFNTVSSA